MRKLPSWECGKSHAAIEALTASDKRFLYTVPTIELGGQIKQGFVDRGVDVELFLGRGADDPDHEGEKMCRNLGAVAEAVEAMQPVQKTCCKSGKHVCRFFELCAYQKQFEKKPRGWIATSDTLFHRHRVFRKVQIIVIDEAFVEKSLRGVNNDQIELPIKSLSESSIVARRLLGRDLDAQVDDGGLQRTTIIGGDEDDPMLEDDFLSRLKIAEWGRYKELSKRLGLLPGTRSRMHKKVKKKLISEIILARQIIVVINEIQHLADHPIIKISGRLQIENIGGIRHITWRGLASISKQFRLKPVIYLDATMPSKEVLKPHFPQMEIKTALPVAMPESVFTLQVRRAPTSAEKLIYGSHVERHRREMKLYILQRWMELGCQPTLVIAQKHFAAWLRAQMLPDNIAVKHYNSIAGIDAFKNVRLQILLGRPQPGPEAIETLAATMSGAMPDVIIDQNGDQFSWYDREPVGIRLRNGRVRMVQNDRHPDPFCEANRFLITEGELVQAYGRARPLTQIVASTLGACRLMYQEAHQRSTHFH
jgi:hypothetical protein